MAFLKRQCPKCWSDRVIGFTDMGTYTLSCLNCEHHEKIQDAVQAAEAWYVEYPESQFTCPECKSNRIKEAYKTGLYFVRCECGRHETFASALAMVGSAWSFGNAGA